MYDETKTWHRALKFVPYLPIYHKHFEDMTEWLSCYHFFFNFFIRKNQVLLARPTNYAHLCNENTLNFIGFFISNKYVKTDRFFVLD